MDKPVGMKVVMVPGLNNDFAIYVGKLYESDARIRSHGLKLRERDAEDVRRVMCDTGVASYDYMKLDYRP